jgi:methionyl-tRNA formyltransferase
VRVGFFCMPSVLSIRALAALFDGGCDVRWVVQPAGRARRAEAFIERADADRGPVDPMRIASEQRVPVFRVGDASAEPALRLYRESPVDLSVIAFFNQLLRAPALDLLGDVVNLHPSLLPKLRGPAPLFWTFKKDLRETGLTLHRVTPREDDGDILWRRPMPVRPGARAEELVDELGHLATSAIRDHLRDPGARGVPQDEGLATRAPRPDRRARRVDHDLDAAALFRFVRGAGRLAELWVDDGAGGVQVTDAVRYVEGERPPADLTVDGKLAVVRARDGYVSCQVA